MVRRPSTGAVIPYSTSSGPITYGEGSTSGGMVRTTAAARSYTVAVEVATSMATQPSRITPNSSAGVVGSRRAITAGSTSGGGARWSTARPSAGAGAVVATVGAEVGASVAGTPDSGATELVLDAGPVEGPGSRTSETTSATTAPTMASATAPTANRRRRYVRAVGRACIGTVQHTPAAGGRWGADPAGRPAAGVRATPRRWRPVPV